MDERKNPGAQNPQSEGLKPDAVKGGNSQPPNVSTKPNIILLLRLCTVLLAAVSFWSTAQGMKEYTFAEGWQAYAASLGIQGLLLGLNFSLPHFIKQYGKWYKAVPLVLFSIIVMLCSSWFSFLYIAGQGYQGSWDTKRQLMAQETYRDQLFAAENYVERYDEELGNELIDQIQQLYEKAANMTLGKVEIASPIWEEERETYIINGGAAAGEMTTVIQAMETAMTENAGQDVRQQALGILTTQQTSLQSNIESLSVQIAEAQQTVERNQVNLDDAERRLRNRPEDTNISYYQNAADRAAEILEASVERLDTLQQRLQSYQDALDRINYYASLLGMAEEGVDSYYIGTNLREIQGELLQPEPNLNQLMELSLAIFERLQSAEDLGSDNGTAYQEFMSLINNFISNLEKRLHLKDSKVTLQYLVQELASGNLLSVQESVKDAVGVPKSENGTLPKDDIATDDETGSATEVDDWSKEWVAAFNELKFKISGLPSYNGDISILSSNDSLRFDRGEAALALDKTVEQYLTDHNTAEEGLIYLFSDYNMMAVFAMVLAILLDLAAFITGIIIEREESKLPTKKEDHSIGESPRNFSFFNDREQIWAGVRCLNQYLFLTGDYTYLDGIYTYKTIEQGVEGQIALTGPDKTTGLYLWKGQTLQSVWSSKSGTPAGSPQAPRFVKLLYKVDTGGPMDGVYEDCEIFCEDGLLFIDQSGTNIFLGNVDLNMPVYKLSTQVYDVIPAKELRGVHGQTIVVALDREGLQIATVYISL